MAVSTTGRRLLCILCSFCVLSKMLKLCGAEGSSFRWLMGAGSCFWWVPFSLFLKWISVLSSVSFVGGSPDRSAMMLLSGFDWCFSGCGMLSAVCYWGSVREIHFNFEVDHVSEVACWILSTVCVEAASVQQLGVRSLDAVNFFVGWDPSDFWFLKWIL